MDPFAWAPAYASRIGGLGGEQTAAEEAYAFQTGQLIAPAGFVVITIRIDGLRASRGTLLIEVAGVDGAERRQLELRTLSLVALAEGGGVEQIALTSARRDTYAVAGYIYDDSDAVADAMSVSIAVSGSQQPAARPSASGIMAKVARLVSVEPPNFTHPVSQIFSPEQINEEAFRSVCRILNVAVQNSSWSAAFLFHALRYQFDELAGRRGLGVGRSASVVTRGLASQGAEVDHVASFDPAEWPEGGNLDFVWLDVDQSPEPPLFLFIKACCLIERLRIGGVLAMTFPLEHGRMPSDVCDVPKRSDVEIIALKMLAGGHSVAELKFRTVKGPLQAGMRTPCSLIVHRME
jgi:hypothetical protein